MRCAPARSPSMKRRAAGPSTTASKNRRRSSVSRSFRRVPARSARSHDANSPILFGIRASSRSRKRRASTGDEPPVEIATITGSRSMIAGTMKREASRSSTTLTGMWRDSLKLAIQRFTARREVATMTRRAPSKSSAANSRMASVNCPAAARAMSSGAITGATTVIDAPVRSRSEILRSATSPPPTMSTFWPARSKKTGK